MSVEDTITDTMWMLAPDAYLRLVHDAGWRVEQFQARLADLLQRMFLERLVKSASCLVRVLRPLELC